MISAQEKREQMSFGYWLKTMRTRVAVDLMYASADVGYIHLELDVPKQHMEKVWEELNNELTSLGYETTIVENAPDQTLPQIFIRWSE